MHVLTVHPGSQNKIHKLPVTMLVAVFSDKENIVFYLKNNFNLGPFPKH